LSKKALLLPFTALAMGLTLAACGQNSEPGLARGQELYETCVPCHGKSGAGDPKLAAPAIAGMPEWYVVEQLNKFRTSVRGAHPDDMEGHRMRPMARSLGVKGDIESVSKYVAGMPATHSADAMTGGDAVAGGVRYNSVCIACHGPAGKGMEALKAPGLVGQADWYMYSQLNKFKSGMRGAHPQDITGSQMRAMALTLENDQVVRDVVAYIRTLK
jgi:cytochrome c553